jgi:hypothetical protein
MQKLVTDTLTYPVCITNMQDNTAVTSPWGSMKLRLRVGQITALNRYCLVPRGSGSSVALRLIERQPVNAFEATGLPTASGR